jgi:hypothetical protein
MPFACAAAVLAIAARWQGRSPDNPARDQPIERVAIDQLIVKKKCTPSASSAGKS